MVSDDLPTLCTVAGGLWPMFMFHRFEFVAPRVRHASRTTAGDDLRG